jgi:flagellar hook protein FlgE
VTGTVSPNTYELSFSNDGVLTSIQSGTSGFTDTGITSGTPVTGLSISFTLAGANPAPNNLLNGAAKQTISLDLSGMTQDATTSSTNAITITTNTNDGSLGGQLSSIAISATGMVSATYANSSATASTTTVDVAQIPLATFADEEGLTAISGSTFALSTTSGSPTLVTAGTEGTGNLTGSALNSSTTDTSTQFDNMITAEQAYSAAAQVVTYDTKMFDSLIQAVA